MKNVLFFLVLLLAIPMIHFAKGAKKIAQRHDDYVNANWKGFDSLVFTYNIDTFQTGLTSVKGNASNSWDNNFKYTSTYSSTNKLTQQIRETGNGNVWINFNKYTYTYDANDNNTLVEYDVWNGTSWVPNSKIVYSNFNTSGKYAKEEVFNWDGSTWKNFGYNLQTYVNNAVKLQSTESYSWNNSTFTFDKIERIYYNYNQDSVSIITKSYPDTNNIWFSTKRELYNYNFTPFRLNEYVEQIIDTATLTWVNDNRIKYSYATNGLIDKTASQTFTSASIWDSTAKSQYIYDANNNLIEYFDEVKNGNWNNNTRRTMTIVGNNPEVEFQYIGNGSTWNLDKKINYQYNIEDDVTFKQTEQYNGTYTPLSRDYYYYINGLLDVANLQNKNPIILFPNPANDKIMIQLEAENQYLVNASIIDIHGRLMKTISQSVSKNQNYITLSISDLSSGNYILQLSDEKNNSISVSKFEVLK